MKRISFLGYPVDSLSMGEAIERLEEFIETRVSHVVVALNVPKLYRMERDPLLNNVVGSADLILPEMVVTLTSRIFGEPLKAYIGNDRLTKLFLAVAARKGYRVYFLGTRKWILEKILVNLKRKYPMLIVAGCHDGFFSDNESEDIMNQICSSRADVLFVGMGTPRQECWMDTYGRRSGVPVMIGVGGTLDLLAGTKKEPPVWVKKSGVEWVYRLAEDPRGKLMRYFTTLPWFLWIVIKRGILLRCCSWLRR